MGGGVATIGVVGVRGTGSGITASTSTGMGVGAGVGANVMGKAVSGIGCCGRSVGDISCSCCGRSVGTKSG